MASKQNGATRDQDSRSTKQKTARPQRNHIEKEGKKQKKHVLGKTALGSTMCCYSWFLF